MSPTAPRQMWLALLGSPTADALEGVHVRTDGGIVIAGFTNGSLPGAKSSGYYDGFIARYGPSGVRESVLQFGTAQADYVYSISSAADKSGSVFVGGCTEGSWGTERNKGSFDIFLAKFDPGHDAPAWVTQFGSSSYEWLYASAALGQGDVLIGGTSLGVVAGPASFGGHDCWVGRVDGATGRSRWLRQFGSAGNDWVYAVAAHEPSGHLAVGGVTKGSMAGPNQGKSDVWLARFDQDGRQVWLVQEGSAEVDFLHALAVDGDAVFAGGYTAGAFGAPSAPADGPVSTGGTHAWVAKYSFEDGKRVWVHQFPTQVYWSVRVGSLFNGVNVRFAPFAGGKKRLPLRTCDAP